jgi:hypothetical protein
MNPRGNVNMGACRSNSQPFLKDSCRVNLVVQLERPIFRRQCFGRTTRPRRASRVDHRQAPSFLHIAGSRLFPPRSNRAASGCAGALKMRGRLKSRRTHTSAISLSARTRLPIDAAIQSDLRETTTRVLATRIRATETMEHPATVPDQLGWKRHRRHCNARTNWPKWMASKNT